MMVGGPTVTETLYRQARGTHKRIRKSSKKIGSRTVRVGDQEEMVAWENMMDLMKKYSETPELSEHGIGEAGRHHWPLSLVLNELDIDI